MGSTIAYLSLGSNIGDRIQHLRQACASLNSAGIQVVSISSVYETEPVDVIDQDWFLNCVVAVETNLSATALLDRCQQIEQELGRVRERPKGPRTIDLDILLFGDSVIQSERLTIPHPRMFQRKFVLQPLSEIAPRLRPAGQMKTVDELLASLSNSAEVRRTASLHLGTDSR